MFAMFGLLVFMAGLCVIMAFILLPKETALFFKENSKYFLPAAKKVLRIFMSATYAAVKIVHDEVLQITENAGTEKKSKSRPTVSDDERIISELRGSRRE